MLRELHIKNFSIIDDVHIEFGEGLNVLTGETGAGKSIIIDALCLSLGERAASEVVRSGEKEALVEAFFEVNSELLSPSIQQFLSDNSIDLREGCILKRIISSQGKSRGYINGAMANAQTLSDISRGFIDVHGQYEHQSLLASGHQLDMFDSYGGLLHDRDDFGKLFGSYNKVKLTIDELVQKENERVRRIDILRYMIDEIDSAHLTVQEEEGLLSEVKVLGSAGRLAELANNAYNSLYASDNSCISRLSAMLHSLREIANIDPRAGDASASMENALPLLEDTAHFLRAYKDNLDFDPLRLEQIQERLELIKGLKRKHGCTVREILDLRENAGRELEELQHSEERTESLKKELKDLRKMLTEKAQALSKKRKAVAKRIEPEVVAQLKDLSMPDIRFSVLITQAKGDDTVDGFQAGQNGIDSIEFLLSTNTGEDLKPLSKVASGGELSRIMLALKSIMAKGDNIPVLVFDEIDAGIGGMTAEKVGRKLKHLSGSHQILCITHLAQIASYADRHLRIEKKVEKERTIVNIDILEKDERTTEVARMLGGGLSDISLKHAREMLRKGKSVIAG